MAENKVEIGFDLSGNPNAQFAKLDDAFYGILDAPQTILGGALYYDVTPFVLEYDISRGKSRQLDRFPAGRATVRLDNNNRWFDPLYEASPYYTQIIPKRSVRVTSNDIIQYEGVADDWDISYAPEGNSVSSLVASDALANLANQTLTGGTATAQYTGERIIDVLADPGVEWPADRVIAETGKQYLQADVIPANQDAIAYIEKIVNSEPGVYFINKQGFFVYKDREGSTAGTPVLFADDGTGIPYQAISVIYGSEFLYNQIVIERLNGGTATANNLDSQDTYEILNYTLSGLPLDNDTSAGDLADYLVTKFGEPEYRFEQVEIELTELTQTQQTQILDLEINDYVQVKFTPNNVPPAINKYAEIIGIGQRATPTSHRVVLKLASTSYGFFRLSDQVFGRLTEGNILGY